MPGNQEKRYNSLNEYLKREFGQKVYKIALNGNMTCPNRDGKIDSRGCIFCSRGGSGEFAADKCLSITEQIEQAKGMVFRKIKNGKYIAYFQAFTNTYAPVEYLKKIFTEAIHHPDIVALSIATRPDCLPNDVLALLSELNGIKPVWIELGLQTIHERTAVFIRRGYSLDCFDRAVEKLKKAGVDIIVHVIIGLPDESTDDIIKTVRYLNIKGINGVKLQLLHILKDTDLENLYHNGEISVLEQKEYIDILIKCIENLDPGIVIHRITGDSPHGMLVAPEWSEKKWEILNEINRECKIRDTWQGRLFQAEKTDF